jgi:murein tripeptide amidase MpaA
VYRVVPQTSTDLKQLTQIQQEYDTKIDFWRDPVAVGLPVDVMVSPQLGHVTDMLYAMGATVMIHDVGALIKQERTGSSPGQYELDKYISYAEIEAWLASNCNDDQCNLVNIGPTFEGRAMWVAQLGDDQDKPVIFLECGIHAREWISPAVCRNIINRLIDIDNPETAAMRNNYNWHILVSSNPDGYEFTRSSDRMWRKTRSVNADSSCLGCDPNRNFDYEWGGAGTSNNPCSDLYRGPNEFSESETANIRDYVSGTIGAERFRAYYSVHSYGQWVLIPWSYARNVYPEDFDAMLRVADDAAAAIFANSGLTYVTGQSANLLGATAGCSDDWAKGSMGIKFAYTLELRDTGTFGFALPDTEIIPNFEEIWDALYSNSELMAAEYPMP